MGASLTLTDATFRSPRHATHYWEIGPVDGPLMIFLHGWPEIGLVWRAQAEAFASEGWHCVAPDMRGYGGSSAPSASEAYALKEIVGDMVELHDHLGAHPAIWIGHDLGSPVAGAMAAHHAKRSRGVVFVSVPYSPEAFALPSLLPLIDRKLYPADQYPDGQWDYYRFYLTHFDQTVTDFNADIPAALAAIYRSGDPSSVGKIYRSALITRNGGWFGSPHRARKMPPDPALWPAADFDSLVEAFRVTGFRPGNSWYLNDAANIAYAHAAPDGGQLRPPVLFVNGDFDGLCDITHNRLGDPMRSACQDLSVTSLPSGHWLPLERKAELIEAIRSWLRRNRHYLDWANMPNPFRHYEDVPILDLPSDPPAPQISDLGVLEGKVGNTSARDGAEFLSQLMFYSASISASKRVPSTGSTYALRVNPSSGNLHPTEFHFYTHGLADWVDGLYHYRPSSHMAEQRAIGEFSERLADASAPVVFVLTSIAWREAWKYQDRAYRYCLHDIGHSWQALTLAARSIGCESFALGQFSDEKIAEGCHLSQDEWPMLIVGLHGPSIPVSMRAPVETILFSAHPNRLSREQVPYPLIERIHVATKLCAEVTIPSIGRPNTTGRGKISLPPRVSTSRGFGDVVRTRRSALDFRGGDETISLSQLSTILSSTKEPLFADFVATRFVHLYLYVHRVEGLAPGVYRYWREHAELEKIKEGDQRLMAAALSLGQDLAGNACLAFSMIGDFENAARSYGDRGYRYVHFEAGAIGQRMYLASEALGLRATGIGAFFDDEVNRYLSLAPELGQVVYHFAIGYPVSDPRLEA